jgi:hypothetical protein|tara:strand:+ start:54 stop:581 length:528 start_codon:yes stop_codon:yes gene_type:complete
MKKIIVLAILGFSLFSIILTNVYAESLYVDANIGDMKKIDESKYRVSGVSIVRNDDGALISVIRVDATRYKENPIIDEFLKSDPEFLVKEGIINNERISLHRVPVEYYNEKCSLQTLQVPGFSDPCNWYHRAFVTMLGITDPEGEQHYVFKGLNHVYVVRSLDQVMTIWDIISKN